MVVFMLLFHLFIGTNFNGQTNQPGLGGEVKIIMFILKKNLRKNLQVQITEMLQGLKVWEKCLQPSYGIQL